MALETKAKMCSLCTVDLDDTRMMMILFDIMKRNSWIQEDILV